MISIRRTAGSDNYVVVASACLCGSDISICIGGGERYHIGAVALAVPRPSLKNPHQQSATTSVLTVCGHKEDDLVRRAAQRFATAFGCCVCVQAGLHIDDASPEEIQMLWANYEAVLEELEVALREVRSHPCCPEY